MNTKQKLVLSLLLVSLVVFSSEKTAVAGNQSDIFNVQEQIRIISEKIKYLQSLIATLQEKLKTENKILAESYLVMDIMDISDNSVVMEKNIQKTYPIASITKLINAVVASENIDPAQTITLTKEMLKPDGYSPSLFLGLSVSSKNLLKASLIQSTNDAAEALSYFVGNEKFVGLMNQKAKALEMNNTYFYDAHGLSSRNRSTARDIFNLLRHIYEKRPEILSIGRDDNFWLPDPTGKMLKFKNVNNFHDHPYFIGGKTGYLPEAKQSLASLFNINGRVFAVILLRSPDRQSDALKIVDWIKTNL